MSQLEDYKNELFAECEAISLQIEEGEQQLDLAIDGGYAEMVEQLESSLDFLYREYRAWKDAFLVAQAKWEMVEDVR